MLYPSLDEVKRFAQNYKSIPVFYEVLTDSCSPVQIMSALGDLSENSFMLESVENSEQWGRYSFIGICPKMEISIRDGLASTTADGRTTEQRVKNPVAFLSGIADAHYAPQFPGYPKLTGGLIGYFGYDTVRYIEPRLTNIPPDDLGMADCHLFLFDEIVAYDHLTSKTIVILNILSDTDDFERAYAACSHRAQALAALIEHYVPSPAKRAPHGGEIRVTSNLTRAEYVENVKRAQHYITEGDIFQVVLSQRFEIENPPAPFDVYRCLRSANPSPYLYYFKFKEYQVAGASPEMLVNVTGGVVSTRPIAGTIRRGATEEEDSRLRRQMLNDPKERAEHTMLVDLGRNDVGKVSKFGTVEVTDFMKVESYSKVSHLVSNVRGELAEGKNALDALMAVLPAGTLSGAPKVRAMEIIDELENCKRGLYGGTVGYLGFDGSIDTCIAIRTVLFRHGKAYVQAGAGIVADSVPENEFTETENKALAVINAIKEATKL
ncbi:MAG: anthranilate synthase component I [Intestinibacillus sp.]